MTTLVSCGPRGHVWLHGPRFAPSAAVLTAVVWVVTATLPASAGLTHRYTFNDGTANDSVGSAHGTIFGSAFADADGLLQFPGGANNYVDLPGPAIGIDSYIDATFEAWFTSTQLLSWQRVFDFGDRTVPTNQQGYIYYTPLSGVGTGLGVYANFGQRTEAHHPALATDQLYHMAMVIDDNANGGSDMLSIYINGNLEASLVNPRSLSNVGNTFAYLGKSLVAADPNFIGSMDEFRIYDHALSASEVAASLAAGPTPLTTVQLTVDTVNGEVHIVADPAGPTTFDYYTIASPAGALNPDDWLSLDEQNRDATGDGEGQSWDAVASSDAHRLTEFFLLGASTVSEGQPISLGQAFDPTVFGAGVPGDLTFQFSRQQSPVLHTGEVVYLISEPLAGDYNDDGVVNAADYVLWRNGGPLANDPTPGVGPEDYDLWVANFGNTAASGAKVAQTTAVPEPNAVLLLLHAALVVTATRRRR